VYDNKILGLDTRWSIGSVHKIIPVKSYQISESLR